MKKLDEFGMWLSDNMFREGGLLDTTTKAGLVIGAGYVLVIVLMLVF